MLEDVCVKHSCDSFTSQVSAVVKGLQASPPTAHAASQASLNVADPPICSRCGVGFSAAVAHNPDTCTELRSWSSEHAECASAFLTTACTLQLCRLSCFSNLLVPFVVPSSALRCCVLRYAVLRCSVLLSLRCASRLCQALSGCALLHCAVLRCHVLHCRMCGFALSPMLPAVSHLSPYPPCI
jgi:hypothetical protein